MSLTEGLIFIAESFVLADFVLYYFFNVKFLRLFIKVKTLNKVLRLPIEEMIDGQTIEHHTFLIFLKEGTLWARGSGIDMWLTPGLVLKVVIRKDNHKQARAEIRISPLMLTWIFLFWVHVLSLVNLNTDSFDLINTKFIMNLLVLSLITTFCFCLLLRRFEKKASVLFQESETNKRKEI